MVSEKVQRALNDQLAREMYSGYLYLAMSAWFESVNLPGCAHWMRVQAREEEAHGMRFYSHVVDRLGRVTLQAIQCPPAQWDSPLAAFEAAFEHEQAVTGHINDLLALARAEDDNATAAFLQWFVTEQVEEEAQADKIVQQLRTIGDAPAPLLMLDATLGKRE
jgi:ferritin